MKKLIKILILTLIILMMVTLPVMAAVDTPYESYRYGDKDESVMAPAGYVQKKIVTGQQLGIGSFGKPDDIFKGNDQLLYINNPLTGSLTVLDKNLNLIRTVTFSQKGEATDLSGMGGLFITGDDDNKTYYIADTQHMRIVVADNKGNIFKEILSPPADLMPQGTEFKPTKVLVDRTGVIYAIIPGLYRGALAFSESGNFMTFFGSNKVELTARMLLDYTWKSILNKTQKDFMSRYVPVSFSSFDVDKEGFVYTVTEKTVAGGSIIGRNQLKKINAKSVNIFKDQTYGDLEMAYYKGLVVQTAFVDVDVMSNGCIAALDATQGRVFLYDVSGNLLTIFGDIGIYKGNFIVPVCIETIDDNIYVVDQSNDSITKFEPTEFGKKIMNASIMYESGDYDKSVELWTDILKYDGANKTAYISIGKSYLSNNDYEQAMKYFKLANNRELYSEAFELKRNVVMRDWFIVIFAVLAVFVVWIIVSDSDKKTYRKKDVDADKLSIPKKVKYTMTHPTAGYEAMLRQENTKPLAAVTVICIAVWFFATIIEWQFSGFIFNQNVSEDFSIWIMLGKTVLVFLLFIIANWFVATMMDGSGRLIDIVTVTATGLIPYMIFLVLRTILTNILVVDEGIYLTVLMAIMIIWSFILVFAGLKTMHEFSVGKTISLLVFTIVGILIIIFLALLLWSLFQQLAMFVVSLIEELSIIIKSKGGA